MWRGRSKQVRKKRLILHEKGNSNIMKTTCSEILKQKKETHRRPVPLYCFQIGFGLESRQDDGWRMRDERIEEEHDTSIDVEMRHDAKDWIVARVF